MLISQKGQESISVLLSCGHLLIYVHMFEVFPPKLSFVYYHVPSDLIIEDPFLESLSTTSSCDYWLFSPFIHPFSLKSSFQVAQPVSKGSFLPLHQVNPISSSGWVSRS